MRLRLAVSAIGLVLLMSAAAAAEETNQEKARTWFKQGVKHFDEQQYDEALYAFEQADRLNPSWKIAFNIGQCQAALKRYGLAIEAFERYLAEGGDEVPDDRRTKVLNELSQFRKMVGGVMVTGEDDVVVVIDDIVRGSTPMNQPILVTAGVKHNIELVKQEEVLKTIQETVRGESTLEIEVSGDEDGAPAPAPVPTAPTGGQTAEPADEGGLSPVFFWVGAGATVVFAGGAVGLNFAIAGKKNDDDTVPAGDYDAAKGMRAAGLACFGLAVAAGVTTTVLAFFTDWDGSGEEEVVGDLQVGPFGSARGGGLALQGSF